MNNFLKNYYIKLILLFLIGLAGVPLLIHGLNKEVGYCFEQKKILSDEEIIKPALSAAFEEVIKLDPKDLSYEIYLKNYPECCRIFPKIGLIKGFGSRKYKLLILQYPIREDKKKYFAPSIDESSGRMYFVDECGLVVGGSGD
jgi:hypothetical protein